MNIQCKLNQLKDYQQIILEEILENFIRNNQIDVNEILSGHKYCKHCGSKDLYSNGTSRGIKRFKCSNCGKTQSNTSHTPLHGIKLLNKWVDFIYQMLSNKKVISCVKMSETLDIDVKTAHQWRHRFLAALNQTNQLKITNDVEIDEVYISFSVKGRIGKEKFVNYNHKTKQNTPTAFRNKEKKMQKQKYNSIFLCLHNRQGDFDFVPLRVQKKGAVTSKIIKNALINYDLTGKTVITDSGKPMVNFLKNKPLTNHITFKSKDIKKGLMIDKEAHNNNINNTMMLFNNWSKDFFGYSTKYQWNYLKWFRYIRLFNDHNINSYVGLSLNDDKSFNRFKNIFYYYQNFAA